MSSCTYCILTCQAVTVYTHPVHMNVHYVEGVCWRGPLHDMIMAVLPESHSSWGDKQEDLRSRDERIHRTGRPGVLRFMGSQRVGHDWVTDLIWSDLIAPCDNIRARWCLCGKEKEEKPGHRGDTGKSTQVAADEIWWRVKTCWNEWGRSDGADTESWP